MVESGKKKATEELNCNSKRGRSQYITWSSYEDDVILQLLVEEVGKGNNLSDGQWTKGMWPRVLRELAEKTGIVKTKDNVINRQKTWRKIYCRMKELLDKEGFTWDSTKKMLLVEENAWNDYLETHKDAYSFRHHACRNYDLLKVLFGRNGESRKAKSAAGSFWKDNKQQDVVEEPVENTDEVDTFSKASSHSMGMEASTHEGFDDASGQHVPKLVTPCQRYLPHSSGDNDEILLCALSDLCVAIKDFIGNRRIADGWYEALEEVSDLDSDFRNRAVLLLDTSDKKVAFCKKPPNERKRFLEFLASQ